MTKFVERVWYSRVPAGEVWESVSARWCPFCHGTQMAIAETRPIETMPGNPALTGVTLVWRCPVCSADGEETPMTLATEQEQLRERLVEEGATDIMTTDEMTALYEVDSFCMGLVFVTRKSDGLKGTLDFSHMPRLYFNFMRKQ